MIDLTHQKVNLLLVGFPLGHTLSHANKQASSIGLGSRAEETKLQRRSRPSLVRIISSAGCASGSVEMIWRICSSTSPERSPYARTVQSSMRRSSSLE